MYIQLIYTSRADLFAKYQALVDAPKPAKAILYALNPVEPVILYVNNLMLFTLVPDTFKYLTDEGEKRLMLGTRIECNRDWTVTTMNMILEATRAIDSRLDIHTTSIGESDVQMHMHDRDTGFVVLDVMSDVTSGTSIFLYQRTGYAQVIRDTLMSRVE